MFVNAQYVLRKQILNFANVTHKFFTLFARNFENKLKKKIVCQIKENEDNHV